MKKGLVATFWVSHQVQHKPFNYIGHCTNRAVQLEMAGGLKFWVKKVEGLHYLFSEYKNSLNSGWVTAKLIFVFILFIFILFFTFFVLMKIVHITNTGLKIF